MQKSRINVNYKLLFFVISAVFILGVLLFIRLYNLHADPPAWKRWGDIFDEGCWITNPRSLNLFGKWIIGEHHMWIGSPLISALWAIVFKFYGVGFVTTRILSATSGFLTVLIIFWVMLKTYGRTTAIVISIFLGLNGTFLMYNRLALIETPLIFFVVLFLVLWGIGQKKTPCYFVSGIAFALACLTKINVMLYIPTFALIWLWENFENLKQRKIWYSIKPVVLAFFGFMLIMAPYMLFIYFPNLNIFRMQYGHFNAYYNFSSLRGLWKEFNMKLAHSPGERIFGYAPVALLVPLVLPFWLSLLTTPGFKFRQSFYDIKKPVAYSFIFLVSGWFLGLPFGFIDRRQVIFILPLTILAAHIITIVLFEGEMLKPMGEELTKPQLLLVILGCIYSILTFVFIYCWRDNQLVCTIEGKYIILALCAISLLLFTYGTYFKRSSLQIGRWAALLTFIFTLFSVFFVLGRDTACVWFLGFYRNGLAKIVPNYGMIYFFLFKGGALIILSALIFKRFSIKTFISKPAVAVFASLLCLVNLVEVYVSVFIPTTTLYNESQRLGEILPKGALCLGDFSHEVGIENKIFPFAIYKVNDKKSINKDLKPGYYILAKDETRPSEGISHLTTLNLLPDLFAAKEYRVILEVYRGSGETIFNEK